MKKSIAIIVAAAMLVMLFAAPVMACGPYTQGFWKNHTSIWGEEPEVGDCITTGDDFFNSGKTWLQVLETPTEGNAYYILAHQYIAAKLNLLMTTAPGEILAAIGQAADILGDATGDMLAEGDRAEAIMCAEVLDAWNNSGE